ncbi:tetratricopeptide repeat protein [Candidatus Omnitrophota bacterium]
MLERRYIYLILIGLCVLVYANSLRGDFISDDLTSILRNPRMAQPLSYWHSPHDFLNSLCYNIAGLNTLPYHICSIIFHAVASILAFIFLRLFFRELPSLFGAALFAVHPIHTEAVSWISGRTYVITAVFVFTTYLLYYRATESKTLNRRLYLLSLLIFAYYINKQYSFYAFFPFMVILSDIVFARIQKNWKLWLPFLAILALRLIMAREAIQARLDMMIFETAGVGQDRSVFIYFMYSFFVHLWLFLWPAKLRLYHGSVIMYHWSMWFGFVALSGIAGFLPVLFKKAKGVFFGLGIFALFLAPTYSPFLIAHLVAERYAYLPSIFFSILVSFLYEKYCLHFSGEKRVWVMLLSFVILASFAVRTVARNEDWKSNERFWKVELAVSPRSPDAHNNIAVMYLQEQNVVRAMREFQKAIELNSNYYNAYNNLGLTYRDVGRKEEAITMLEKAIAINPRRPKAHYNLGLIYKDIWHVEAALGSFDKAIASDPRYIKAYDQRAALYARTGKISEALADYSKIIEIDPGFSSAHFHLARLYAKIGEYQRATKHYNKAAALGYAVDPEFLRQLEPNRDSIK